MVFSISLPKKRDREVLKIQKGKHWDQGTEIPGKQEVGDKRVMIIGNTILQLNIQVEGKTISPQIRENPQIWNHREDHL